MKKWVSIPGHYVLMWDRLVVWEDVIAKKVKKNIGVTLVFRTVRVPRQWRLTLVREDYPNGYYEK